MDFCHDNGQSYRQFFIVIISAMHTSYTKKRMDIHDLPGTTDFDFVARLC